MRRRVEVAMLGIGQLVGQSMHHRCLANDVVVDGPVIRLDILVDVAGAQGDNLDDDDERPEVEGAEEDDHEVVEAVRKGRVDGDPDLRLIERAMIS